MSLEAKIYSLRLILVFLFVAPLQGVTVKPERCPTNKIAPHKRSAYHGVRKFGGAYYELLRPGGGAQFDQLSALQERPQDDDPDDCGDIEDYDESDVSSLIAVNQPYTHQGHNNNRFFFGGYLNRPVPTTARPPTRPTYMPLPTPPYWSGGYFGNNHYRPPLQQDPSDYVKPVHEGAYESQSTYRPDIVGGPLGHVVGHRPVRPTNRPVDHSTTKRVHYHTRYPPQTGPTRHTRPATDRPRMFNNDGIFGSFIDLLFK